MTNYRSYIKKQFVVIGYDIGLLLLGLVFLIVGGDLLVRSAVSFADKFGVSSFLIGVTVVSFGTSAPELMVSIQAAMDQAADIAIGNVLGSNIAKHSIGSGNFCSNKALKIRQIRINYLGGLCSFLHCCLSYFY